MTFYSTLRLRRLTFGYRLFDVLFDDALSTFDVLFEVALSTFDFLFDVAFATFDVWFLTVKLKLGVSKFNCLCLFFFILSQEIVNVRQKLCQIVNEIFEEGGALK